MSLPSARDAVQAGRHAEFDALSGRMAEPLPPVFGWGAPSAPLRVVYLMPRTDTGGGARVIFEHANHLTALGAHLTVLSHAPRPSWLELKAEFLHVPYGRALARSIPPCDVIVAGYWDEILPARLLGIAPVVHFEQGDFHLYDELPEWLAPLVSTSLHAADLTVTISEAAERALAERYGVFARRIANAVDRTVFCPTRLPARRSTVVFVGWDGMAFKGIDIARKVADGLERSHPEVGIVWITPAPPVGPEFGTTYVDPPQHELAALIRDASVYVGASRYESFPLPPLEAMASGTPVVSTANAGVLAYARDGENCLLAPIDDADGLLEATRRVLDDPQLAQRLRVAGLDTAAAFDWGSITSDLLELYRGLASSIPIRPAEAIEFRIDGLEFESGRDRTALVELAVASPYAQFAIPVSQPAFDEYRVVRWVVVATKAKGIADTAYAYLPARSDAPIEDVPHQFGIDLLREGRADDAFSFYVAQCQQAPEPAQVLLGRWVVLSLIAAGRAAEAMDLAMNFARANASHPDYYLLTYVAALEARRPLDASSTLEAIEVLESGACFEEWLDHPREVLSRRLVS